MMMDVLQQHEIDYIDRNTSARAKSVILGETDYVLHQEGDLHFDTYDDHKEFLIDPDKSHSHGFSWNVRDQGRD